VQTNVNGSAILTISSHAVWYLDNSLANWKNIGNFTGAPTIGRVFASQGLPGLFGITFSSGHSAVTSNAGATLWAVSTQLTAAGVVLDSASSIAFPTTTPTGRSPGDVYLAASSAWTLADKTVLVPDQVGHLFVTSNRGMTWSPLHGNGTGADLPNVPIEVVRFDPGDVTNNTIYVGTDLGMYRSTDAGKTWHRFGRDLPLVRVSDMYISKNSSLIRIATYGRGIWEIYPSSSAAKGANGDGDFDRNSKIDWVDLGAMASRLGTTPATPGWPTYTWIDDMTPGSTNPPVDLIDDEDLAALLAIFGDHP
jgi:hypothetical protein